MLPQTPVKSIRHVCRSTGKVANLTIKATLSNCILHRRGKVTVESCKLQCYAGGLEHLFTPLVTLATAGLRVQREHLTRPMLTGREAGMGVLSVIETKIRVRMLPCASASALYVSRMLCCKRALNICLVTHWAWLLPRCGVVMHINSVWVLLKALRLLRRVALSYAPLHLCRPPMHSRPYLYPNHVRSLHTR